MQTYDITHETTYRYYYPVTVSHHSAILEPKSVGAQRLLSFSMKTDPECLDLRHREDYFGNKFSLFSIQEKHHTLKVVSQSRVQVARLLPDPDSLTITCGELASQMRKDELPFDVLPFAYASTRVALDNTQINEYAGKFIHSGRSLYEACLELTEAIYKEFEFDAQSTDVDTPVSEFFRIKRGVCQDFSHLMISCLRSQGIPACYVSGYILTQPPPGKPKLEGSDASHAWVGVYFPGYGWLYLDPTNNLLIHDEHVTVAKGMDFEDVSPVRGAITGGGNHTIDVGVTMKPLPNGLKDSVPETK